MQPAVVVDREPPRLMRNALDGFQQYVERMRTLRSSASWRLAVALLPLVAATGCTARVAPPPDAAASRDRLMTPQELQALPSQAPDRRIAYGEDLSQYGELRVPVGPGPHP